MSVTPSTMLKLGTSAPFFELPDTEGNLVSLKQFDNSTALFVMFICNHCPYVKHIADALSAFTREYESRGLASVAISSNDVNSHPHDGPIKMKEEKALRNYPFPYLYDETQQVAKSYRAACTPDFFLFDKDRKLVYRGQFDDSRPGSDKAVTGKDIRQAVDLLLSGKKIPENQSASMGCNIKWREGNEPEYF